MKERTGCAGGLEIELRKKIPVGAGLGGGSSDAAATLEAANELWGLGRCKAELARLASELGSDVPFFLLAHAAVCRGRGERVEPVRSRLRAAIVLAHPNVHLSTRAVYANLAEGHLTKAAGHATLVVHQLGTARTGALRNVLCNRLESAAM